PERLRARGGCWFRAGAQELHVGVEEPFAPARKAHPGLVVDDLAALEARLAAAGIRAERDASLPGVRRSHVADPFGNRLELREGQSAPSYGVCHRTRPVRRARGTVPGSGFPRGV